MTLLVAVFAAVTATALWYKTAPDGSMLLGLLSLIYWGASLMWLVDGAVAFFEEGAAVFHPAPAVLLDDLFLGLAAVALGLVIWIAALLLRDPKGVVRAMLFKKKD